MLETPALPFTDIMKWDGQMCIYNALGTPHRPSETILTTIDGNIRPLMGCST